MSTSLGMGLFSRIRPPPPPGPERKVRGFLGLPGELRNKIYDCYFERTEGHRVELAARGTNLGDTCLQQLTCRSKSDNPTGKQPSMRMTRRLGSYKRVDGLQTKWTTSLCALILVCRQVFQESISLLYRHTSFVFAAPRRIDNFLKVISQRNLADITMLQLHYDSYGPPYLRTHIVLQEKHVKRWTFICKALSKSLTSLRELHLKINVHDADFRMDLRQAWLQPLLPFRRMSNRKGHIEPSESPIFSDTISTTQRTLNHITVDFQSHCHLRIFYDNPRLAEASRNLHRLFGEAVSLAILGASEEVAMRDFNEAWQDKYKEWHHHLNYSNTGW